MRIRSINIESFGNVRNKKYSFDKGLTVIYGKNETGKTTMMEFIRSTMFPPESRRITYPHSAKTDSGQMNLENADGTNTVLSRKHKEVTVKEGTKPGNLVSVDADTYSSVFAMSISDMRSNRVISSGEIKSKFLTIPGGEYVKATTTSLEEESLVFMTKETWSESRKIGVMTESIRKIEAELLTKEKSNAEYSAHAASKATLEKQKSELQSRYNASLDAEKKIEIFKSQEGNTKTLCVKKDELAKIAALPRADEEAMKKCSELSNALQISKGLYDNALKDANSSKQALGGSDYDAILKSETSINNLTNSVGDYSKMRNEYAYVKEESERKRVVKEMPVVRKPTYLVLGASALIATSVIGQITGMPLLIAVGAIALLACVAVYYKGSRAEPPREIVPNYGAELARISSRLEDMDNDMKRTAEHLGVKYGNFEDGVKQLNNKLVAAKTFSRLNIEAQSKGANMKNAEADLIKFLSAYGGAAGFEEAKNRCKVYEQTVRDIETIERSIGSAGITGEKPEAPAIGSAEIKADMESLGHEIGKLENSMKSIMGDTSTEDLMNRLEAKRAELFEMVKSWATLSMSKVLLDDACNTVYDKMQPTVVKTADSLLNTMTCERYNLDINIMTGDVFVVSGDTKKESKEWSTGLGDQVYLSIKAAVAKEMTSDEGLPLVLDDVLQMFDSDRKAAACKALGELSKDLQILLFTCDVETRKLAVSEGGAAEIILD